MISNLAGDVAFKEAAVGGNCIIVNFLIME